MTGTRPRSTWFGAFSRRLRPHDHEPADPADPQVRPAPPLAPIVISLAILGAWWLVAHNSGSGWVQALGDVAFGTLVIGIFGPAVAAGPGPGPGAEQPARRHRRATSGARPARLQPASNSPRRAGRAGGFHRSGREAPPRPGRRHLRPDLPGRPRPRRRGCRHRSPFRPAMVDPPAGAAPPHHLARRPPARPTRTAGRPMA